MKRLKAGVVGTGFIGMKHIEAISRIPQAELTAVVEAYAPKLEEMKERFGVRGYSSVEEMLEHEDLDVVHNCTPTKMHYAINEAVIRAGKCLYCEKPLGLSSEEGEKLLTLLKEHPVANAINLNYRMNALVQDMHDRITAGEEGRPFMVTGSYIQDWMMMRDDTDWRLDPSVGGASRAIADIGSHLFDTTQFVLGKKITAVNAQLMIMHPTRTQYEKTGGTFSKEKGKVLREIEVVNEDAASIMARFEDGTPALFQVSQISAGHKNDMRVRFDMEKCSCEWRQEDSNNLYIGRRNEANQVLSREASALSRRAAAYTGLPAGHPEGWNDVMYQAINAFYQSVLNGTQENRPYATIEEGAWIMKIIDACLKSDKLGRWVSVETGEEL